MEASKEFYLSFHDSTCKNFIFQVRGSVRMNKSQPFIPEEKIKYLSQSVNSRPACVDCERMLVVRTHITDKGPLELNAVRAIGLCYSGSP